MADIRAIQKKLNARLFRVHTPHLQAINRSEYANFVTIAAILYALLRKGS
jgi:hypothetical protein